MPDNTPTGAHACTHPDDCTPIALLAANELHHALTRPPRPFGLDAKVNGLTDFVTMAQLCMVLGEQPNRASPRLLSSISRWLMKAGWHRTVREATTGTPRLWGYQRPATPPITPVPADLPGCSHEPRPAPCTPEPPHGACHPQPHPGALLQGSPQPTEQLVQIALHQLLVAQRILSLIGGGSLPATLDEDAQGAEGQ